MISKVAVIGDPHGCIDEFRELCNLLSWQSLDQIWTVGDLVDRGPDSHGVIDLCRKLNIHSVMGNHDQSILNHTERFLKEGKLPKNPEKRRTLAQLTPLDISYLKNLPKLHVIDDLNLVIVHGGLWPTIPLYAQPDNVIRAQMISSLEIGRNRWWGKDAIFHVSGKTEEQNRLEGYERWYRLYDHEQTVIFGHSTFAQPMVHQSRLGGICIGIDTGSCFGGMVSACVFSNQNKYFIGVKAKSVYHVGQRNFWEE